MNMFDGRASLDALVFVDEDVAKSLIGSKVQHSLTIGSENGFKLPLRQQGDVH